MPTYEYACSACGHRFEEFQSITAKPLTKCPRCKKNKVQRLISGGAGFLFKGSGFYITDYRSDSYKSAAKAETGGKTEGKSAESKPAESKPAAKSEAKPASKSSKDAA